MTRDLPRPNFHSSQLIRCLAELDLLEGAEPAGDFADELGQWMHFTDAIALSSVLESGMAKVPAQSPALREATGARLVAEFERIRAFMVNSITKSCAPTGGNTAIKLPLPLEPEVSYAPYRRFYEAHQRDMELSVEPLRVNLRAALAQASPRLRKLAELDVVMEKFLRERESRLLARVPRLLQKRFDAQYAAHQEQLAASGQPDNPASWMHPGGWLARFCQTLQTLLLAEAELRLQPSAGLLEAFNQQKDHE
ncbi:DUF3348 family protein [Massilia glaciei]|uniref:DUF3348 domain-containing protein n=1 Tax=Massilia glaciei TaxID=1524097 RepID=A0A2U2I7D6_9BURK|nr:DUF3348 family protein [Massilia glaciei]PWF55661.1 DUF3348 domain-containing protein [Massilia glaciei]